MKEVHFQVTISRGVILCAGAVAMLLAAVPELGSESVTVNTYYPAPSGVYTRLITTSNTLLARDNGNVGVGVANPQSKLSVAGGIQIGFDPAACTPVKAGTQRWNPPNIEICDGVNPWRVSVSSVGAPSGVVFGATPSGVAVVHNLGQYVPVSLTSEHFDNCGGSGNCISHGAYVCAQDLNSFTVCNPPLWPGAFVRYWYYYW
jgi:hypothetical protein